MDVRIHDMRRAMRLVSDLRDFVPGTETQARHLISGIGAIVGAYVTMSLELESLPRDPKIVRVFDEGWAADSARQHFVAYLGDQTERSDPMGLRASLLARSGEVVTVARSNVVENNVWYRSKHFEIYRRLSGLDDCIYSIHVGPRVTRCLTFHRPWRARPFTELERAIVDALHAECVPLLADTGSTVRGTLNRRLRQTLDGLLRGLSEKELASELAISRHTLHGYVKTLYRRVGVSSRGELHALFGRMSRPR